MKKIFFLFFLFLLISCTKETPKLSIINATTKDGINYEARVTYKDNFDLSYYILDNEERYEVYYHDTLLEEINKISLVDKENAFYIKSKNSAYVLTVYVESIYNLTIYNEDILLLQLKLKEGTLLDKTKILGMLDEIEGYDMQLELPLIIEEDLNVELMLSPKTYQIEFKDEEQIYLEDVQTNSFIPNPKNDKTGYTFVGWEMNGIIVKDDELYIPSKHGFTAVAIYEVNKYQLTFHILNNTIIKKCKFDEKIEYPTVRVEGYQFIYFEKEGQEFKDSILKEPTDLTLTAKLIPNTYKITYHYLDNTYEQFVSFNSAFTLFDPGLDDYIVSSYTYNDTLLDSGIYSYAKDIDVLIHLTKKIKTIEFLYELFGGTLEEKATIEDDGRIRLPIPTKEGFLFSHYTMDLISKEEVTQEDLKEGCTLYAVYYKDTDGFKCIIPYTLKNTTTSLYDEITLYDSATKISTSLYWYKIAVKKVLDDYVVTGVADSGVSINTLSGFDYCLMVYEGAKEEYNLLKNSGIEKGDIVTFSIDPALLKNGSVLAFLAFEKPTLIYEEEIAILKERYDSLTFITDNLDLVTSIHDLLITWKSNNEQVLSSTGIIHPSKSDTLVKLEAYIGSKIVYELYVTVKGTSEEEKYLSTGYLYTNYASLTQNACDKLDIIYCSFLEIDEQANFTNKNSIINNIKNYVLPKTKKSGTKVSISINQSSSKAFSTVAGSQMLTKKLADNLLSIVKELEIDGIDIDWETPIAAEKTNFTSLMKEIYETLKKENNSFIITAAIGGGMWQPPRYDLEHSKDYLDYINMMTYSMVTSNGQYQNALYPSTKKRTLKSCSISESVEIYNSYGIKNSQILVGIPFYVTLQKECEGVGSITGKGSSIKYETMLNNYKVAGSMIEYFDEECKVPYRYDAVNKLFLSYDNERSIEEKCKYIHEQKLAGMMFWQYGQDVNDLLTSAIYKYL